MMEKSSRSKIKPKKETFLKIIDSLLDKVDLLGFEELMFLTEANIEIQEKGYVTTDQSKEILSIRRRIS